MSHQGQLRYWQGITDQAARISPGSGPGQMLPYQVSLTYLGSGPREAMLGHATIRFTSYYSDPVQLWQNQGLPDQADRMRPRSGPDHIARWLRRSGQPDVADIRAISGIGKAYQIHFAGYLLDLGRIWYRYCLPDQDS